MSEKRKAYLLLQQLPGFDARRRVYRVLSADACKVQGFVGAQTVKLDPCVFPRLLFIGTVGGDLTGSDQKTLPAFFFFLLYTKMSDDFNIIRSIPSN